MLRQKIMKSRAARQLEPKVLSVMKRSLEEQLAGFRGTRSNDRQIPKELMEQRGRAERS